MQQDGNRHTNSWTLRGTEDITPEMRKAGRTVLGAPSVGGVLNEQNVAFFEQVKPPLLYGKEPWLAVVARVPASYCTMPSEAVLNELRHRWLYSQTCDNPYL